ncbi:MAG: type I-C CRISPR-associated protein Cas5c [Oligosphaeraceae bacterium]
MKGFCLDVSGEFACFTRPEMKVERVSYDVITPSAARAIFEAIFWKPAIVWHITKIEVLNPIRWMNLKRNEVSKVASGVKSVIRIEDDRVQRSGLFLKDVRYRLHGEFEFIPPERRARTLMPCPEWLSPEEERQLLRESLECRPDEKPAKYAAMFERRALKGQYFMHPYLGCREFSCREVRLVRDMAQEPTPIQESRDLGFMLYDMDYHDPQDIQPMFFRAQMEQGVIITDSKQIEVLK